MKNKNKLIAISTGLASIVLAITMFTITKKNDEYKPRLDIIQSNSIENYLTEYQQLFETSGDLILNDYNYYQDLYTKIMEDGATYDIFGDVYTITNPEGETIEATSKTEEDGKVYYKKSDTPVRIEDNTKVTIYVDNNTNYVFDKDKNDTISVQKNYSTGKNISIAVNKDNSYSYSTLSGAEYSFTKLGLLEKSQYMLSDKIYVDIYEDGDINYYTEYANNELVKIKRKDGTSQEVYHNYLPSKIIDELPFYKINSCYNGNLSDIYVEYTKNNKLDKIIFENKTNNDETTIVMSGDGSFQGISNYNRNGKEIESKFNCDTDQIVTIINTEKENEKEKRTVTIYNKEGRIIKQEVDGIEKIRLAGNIMYYFDNSHNVERYCEYQGDNYTEYDSNGTKLSYHDEDNEMDISYYPNGDVSGLSDKTKKVNYYENGNISYYLSKEDNQKVKIEGKDYILNYYDNYSLYESGKLESITQEKNGIKTVIDYYESGRLDKKIVNGTGTSYYESGGIKCEFEDNYIIQSYYESGELESKKTADGWIKYYENNNIKEVVKNNTTILYNEDETISRKTQGNLSIDYNKGVPYKYTNLGISIEEDKKEIVKIDGVTYYLSPYDSITLFEDGKIQSIKTQEEYTEYYDTGELKQKVRNGNGRSYYKSGKEEKIIENDKVVKELYESGNLKVEHIDNMSKEYYEDGNLSCITVDYNVVERRYPSGKISYTNYNGEETYYTEEGVITSRVEDGKKYQYYTNGVLAAITENGVRTEYMDDRVFAITQDNVRTIYPCADDYDFYIREDDRNNLSDMFDKYTYIYRNQELYKSREYELSSFSYDEEYGITDIVIRSREDNQHHVIYTNEEYNRSR